MEAGPITIGGHPMKKRSYRSVKVKAVDWEKLGEVVRGERVVFAIDVAKERLVGSVVLASTEEVRLNVSWEHPGESAEVARLVTGLPALKLEVALEPSGTYGDPLRWLFLRRGVEVYRVSPKRSHDAAEVYDGVPSWHDVKSAGLIAKLHVHGASERWPLRSEGERELAAAVRTMGMYDKQAQCNLSRLEAQLARHWPELTTVLDLVSATVLEVVKEYGTPEAVVREEEAARRLMRRVGGALLREEKVLAVVEGARRSIGVPATEGERRAMQELAAEILRCRAAGRRAKAVVKALVEGDEAAQRMGAVIGKTTAAVVISSVGDPRRFESAGALEKAMGLNLKERSSGKHEGQLKITKRGPGECRFYLYLAALRLLMKDPVVAKWYERKVGRDGGKAKNKAVIAVTRKLAKALWHVARGARFDATLLFDAVKLGFKPKVSSAPSPPRCAPESPGESSRASGLHSVGEVLQHAGLVQ